MEIPEYPSGSKLAGPTPLPTPVVQKKENGKVLQKRKPKKGGIINDIFAMNDLHMVLSYLRKTVVVPALQKTISDFAKRGIDAWVYGDSAATTQNGQILSSQPYWLSQTNKATQLAGPGVSKQPTMRSDYSSLIFTQKSAADEVLRRSREQILQTGVLGIDQYYEIIKGIIPEADVKSSYADIHYGWTNLTNCSVVPVDGGNWMIKLPRTEYIG